MALADCWGLNAPLRHWLRLGVCLGIAACRSGAHDTETDRAPATLASPKLFPNTVSTAPPREVQTPAPAAAVAVISQHDLVARFVQKDLSRMSPDEVASHFASVSALERVTFPERLSLETHSPNEALTVAYAL